jgi:hypothetical protein
MKTARWGLATTRILLAATLAAAGSHAVQAAGTVSGAGTSAGLAPQSVPKADEVLKSHTCAVQLAKNAWFDKMAEADPTLVAAVCTDMRAATILAGHKHLDKIADADHFLCRRLTQYHTATERLLRNAHADRVIELDPQGIYWAMDRRPAYARLLSGHVFFYKMVSDNPELGRVVASHIGAPKPSFLLER